MSADERFGTRDLHFSNWHRYALGADDHMIDLDCVGACHKCRMPLYLIETARDVGQEFKATTITRNMARGLNVPAWLVFYTPADGCECRRGVNIDADCHHGVSAMRVRRIYPVLGITQPASPRAFAEFLSNLHDTHRLLHARSSLELAS